MSDEGISELLRLYVLLRGTADPRARAVIRDEIDAMLDRVQAYVPGHRPRNGHDQSPMS